MKKELDILGKKVGQFPPRGKSTRLPEGFLNDCLVILPAGGEGSRFKSVSGEGCQKSAYVLPDGRSMIERTIETYRDLGIKRFLVLLFHNAQSIEQLLGNGEKSNVTISYSYDPEKSVGRGGAMAHAFLQGKILPTDYCIVHNPDDQFVGNTKRLFSDVLSSHIRYEKRGGVATAVVSSGGRYSYSAMGVRKGQVVESESYPFIPIPTHAGVTVFSRNIGDYFRKYFSPEKKSDFEAVLFPVLIKEKRLFATSVGRDAWIPVNDEKGLKQLLKVLSEDGSVA